MILSFIPWWIWAALALVAVIAILLYAPWIVALWSRLPTWLRRGLALIGTLGLAFLAGRNRGAKDVRDQQAKADAHAIQNRKDVDDEVRNLSPSDVDKRLDRWRRD